MVIKLNRDSKLRYFDNRDTSKSSKLFWSECEYKPYFSNKYVYSDCKIILIEKEKVTNNSNEVIKKETLLINNDEIAESFNKHLRETIETSNTFEWLSNNEDLLKEQLIAIIINISEPSKYHENKEQI